MTAAEVKKALGPVLERLKKETFVEGYKASDTEALGILVSKFFEWDGDLILRTSADALEDANFHGEAAAVRKMAEVLA